MKKLFFDTSTKALIIILAKDKEAVDSIFEIVIKDHSSLLMPRIQEILKRNSLDIKDIDEFYVTEGPGSYTGVRIGVTVAKTLSYALNKPLYKISTLKFISASYLNKAKFIVPIIDARRGNVFSTLYKVENNNLVNVLEEGLYKLSDLLQKIAEKTNDSVMFVGLDSENFRALIESNPKFILKSSFESDFSFRLVINVDFEIVQNVHTVIPNYRRLAEAEINLL